MYNIQRENLLTGRCMVRVSVKVFNTTFNNISWQSVLFVEETGENH